MANITFTPEQLAKLGSLPTHTRPAPVGSRTNYGVVLKHDTGIEKVNVFRTQFTPEDVNEFRELLKKNWPVNKNWQTTLEKVLEDALRSWRTEHKKCPYEPFLWALKETDNYVGSLESTAVPQPWLLETVGDAMVSVWKDDDPEYRKALENVLCNWDWYQPVQVMLYVYQTLNTVEEEKIDKYIREEWMYRALYADTAFQCLSLKKKTSENMQHLMQYVSKDVQMDSNDVQIPITNKMRKTMLDYLRSASDDEFAVAKTYYERTMLHCTRKAYTMFDSVFGEAKADELAQLIASWDSVRSDEERASFKRRLEMEFDKGSRQTINEVSAGSERIQRALVEIIERKTFDYSTQFILMAMTDRQNMCKAYQQFIENRHAKYGGKYTSELSFLYGCAYCLMGHPEEIEQLYTAMYLYGIGVEKGQALFAKLRIWYASQCGEQIRHITDMCLKDEESAMKLMKTCARMFNQNNQTQYPLDFDSVCESALAKVQNSDPLTVRYAIAVMDVYEKVSTFQNRNRYKQQLMKLASLTGGKFDRVRTRAEKRIRQLFGAL